MSTKRRPFAAVGRVAGATAVQSAIAAAESEPLSFPTARLPGVVHRRLQQRRPRAVRRHASRTVARLLVFVSVDLVAVWLSAAAAAAAVDVIAAGPLAAAGLGADAVLRSAFDAYFPTAVVLGLLVTGSYARRMGGHPALSLLRGCALATAVTFWGAILQYGAVTAALPLLVTLAALWTLVWLGRRVGERFLARVWPGVRGAAPAVYVGTARDGGKLLDDALAYFGRDYRMLGRVAADHQRGGDVVGNVEDLAELIDRHGIETVVVGGSLPEEQLATVLDVSLTAGCELLYPVSAVKFAGVRPKLLWREDEPFLELGAPVLKARELLVKRVVDLVGAGLGLILLAPLLALLALAVKLDSPGPAFYVQNRAGLGGRRFRMLKFRTMRVGAEDEKPSLAHLNHTGDARLFKIPNDPRCTRLGHWLRRWSLDELPQLWNVLRGDMSLVGPRPFFEADLEAYEDHHFRRLSAKPGITGLWQVNGRSAVVDFEEVVRLDREYIERWSLWLDMYILARTVPAVLGRTGAY